MSGNQLQDLSSETFSNNIKLQDLQLFFNKFTQLSEDIFANLNSLWILSLSDNQLEFLPAKIFSSNTQLAMLWLDNNNITTLEPGVFANLYSLTHLWLHNNKITTLEPGVFAKLSSLTHLWLQSNKITNLEPGVFANLSSLTDLDLSENKLQRLPSKIFGGLSSLIKLFIARNQLDELSRHLFHNMTKLKILNLEGNNITKLHPDQFSGLEELYDLYLSENEITELPFEIFTGLKKLLSINLCNNNIRKISPEHFDGAPNLRFLFLHGNEIYDLPAEMFWNLLNIVRVTLETNLMCCHLEFKEDAGCDFVENDKFANCDSMFSRHFAPRISIWVVGILSLLGALFVLAWRFHFKSKNVVQAIMLMNLALADGLMGVYLLTIAIKDRVWEGEYYLHDYEWRTGLACQITGAISVLSGEVSVMLLALISADRMTKIVFPFHCRGLTRKITHMLCVVIWLIGAIIAFLPMLGIRYFDDPETTYTYYGKSVVCTPLQLSSSRTDGWEYSVGVFVALNLAFLVFILLSYLIIFINRRQVRARSGNVSTEGSFGKRVLCIILTNFASWLPIIAIGIRSVADESADLPDDLSVWMAVFVLPINAAINPILYTLTTPQFQEIIAKKRRQVRRSFIQTFGTSYNNQDGAEEDQENVLVMEDCSNPEQQPEAIIGEEDSFQNFNQEESPQLRIRKNLVNHQRPHSQHSERGSLRLDRDHKQNDNNRDNQSHSNQIPPRAPLACFDADDDLDEDNSDWETEE